MYSKGIKSYCRLKTGNIWAWCDKKDRRMNRKPQILFLDFCRVHFAGLFLRARLLELTFS